MPTKEAVQTILKENRWSKYRLAKQLGVRPIMIDNYLKTTRLGGENADKFKSRFDIEITDAYRPSQDMLDKFAERNVKK
jgi:predicted transcriptional regulator